MKEILKTEILDRFGSEVEETTFKDGSISMRTIKGQYAIYQGGLIQDSRQFCKERNNKVFTKAEIESWKELEWEGKPENYDPFINVGGTGCRHTLDWISIELAVILRPDLKH